MAYYEGETLKQRIERGPPPVDEALDIIVQVARGVAAAHEVGIIHRDIKPANIFLCARQATRASADGAVTGAALVPMTDQAARVKLLDFGIAKMAGETALTRTGTTVGTLAYMAPEHIAGNAVDARADVWSLGVVLYELLAGRLPFDGVARTGAAEGDRRPGAAPAARGSARGPTRGDGRRRHRTSEGSDATLSLGARPGARARGRPDRHGRRDATRRAVTGRDAPPVQPSHAGCGGGHRGHRSGRDGMAAS